MNKPIILLFTYISLTLISSQWILAKNGPKNVDKPSIEQFCDALQNAIQNVPDHQDDDEDFIDAYCDYIRIEHKLDIKAYDDLDDFDHLVVHYRRYKESKKKNKKRNKNAKKIKDHGTTFEEKYGDTPFSDLTDAEIEQRFPKGLQKPDNDRRRLIAYGCSEVAASVFRGVNNQIENIIANARCNKVYDQGASNACWAFATTAQAECNYAFNTGTQVSFSQQHLLDCSGDYQGTKAVGGYIDRTSAWAENKGFCDNYNYAFNPNDPDFNNYCDCNTPMKRSNCYGLRVRNDWDILTRLVANGYAVSYTQWVDSGFRAAVGNVINGCNRYDNAYNHAMTIVGQHYGQYILVKNSWGTNWGSGGYVWVSRAAFESCLSLDYVYLNFDFYNGGYSAEKPLPLTLPNPGAKVGLNENVGGSGKVNSDIKDVNVKTREDYITIISGLIGFIIGAALVTMSCGIFIYCVFTKGNSSLSSKFKYKKVMASDTSDSDAISVNM